MNSYQHGIVKEKCLSFEIQQDAKLSSPPPRQILAQISL